jgi:hypothetical protein
VQLAIATSTPLPWWLELEDDALLATVVEVLAGTTADRTRKGTVPDSAEKWEERERLAREGRNPVI